MSSNHHRANLVYNVCYLTPPITAVRCPVVPLLMIDLSLYVPEKNPSLWLGLNLSVLAFSLYIFVDLFVATDDTSVGGFYLVYNFVTTAVWCAEIGLTVAHKRGNPAREEWVELALAVIFVADSLLALFFQRSFSERDRGMALFDAGLNSLGYSYLAFRNFRTSAGGEGNEDPFAASLVTEEEEEAAVGIA